MSLLLRPQRLQLRTSVLVPCAASHVHYLPDLLHRLAGQTVRPDEVVVAASGGVVPDHVRSYAAAQPFPVRIDQQPAPANASRNRNRAADLCSGDVLIYQDADDLPHPQRVELLRTLFETADVDHVMHGFVKDGPRGGSWSPPTYHAPSVAQTAYYQPGYVFRIDLTNGNPATSRAVHRSIWWDHDTSVGEDVAFNRSVYERFGGRKAVLLLPLLLYRQHLSATRYA